MEAVELKRRQTGYDIVNPEGLDEATLVCRRLYESVHSACGNTHWAEMARIGKLDLSVGFKAGCEILREVLAALRAENERLKAALRTMVYETTHLSPCEQDGSHWCKISADALSFARSCIKAAERNTAEPEKPCTCHPDDNPPRPCPKKYALDECRAAATDMTPEVVVTQGDREAAEMWNGVDPDSYEGDFVSDLATHFAERRAIELENVRTEAEARGRREALELFDSWIAHKMYVIEARNEATSAYGAYKTCRTELQRMLKRGK